MKEGTHVLRLCGRIGERIQERLVPEKLHRHSWRGDGGGEEGVHGRDVDGTDVVDVAGEGHPWEAACLQVPLRVGLIAGGRLCVRKVGDAPALLLTEGEQPLCKGGEGDEEGDDVRRLGATFLQLPGEEGVVGIGRRSESAAPIDELSKPSSRGGEEGEDEAGERMGRGRRLKHRGAGLEELLKVEGDQAVVLREETPFALPLEGERLIPCETELVERLWQDLEAGEGLFRFRTPGGACAVLPLDAVLVAQR